MGLIRDMIVNAAGEAAQEAVRDVAIGAVALVAGAAEGVTKGVQKVSEVAAKIGAPITKKRIEKLSQECEDLYLLYLMFIVPVSGYDKALPEILFARFTDNAYVIEIWNFRRY